MPTPRKRLVSLDETPYYHCISRCVRRAFLCGKDSATGFDFEHRRQWIVDRIKLLCKVFAVDLCAYAVMSNHYHIVVRIDVDTSRTWSDQDVAERWVQLFSGSFAVQRFLKGSSLSKVEQARVTELIATWRLRLQDMSWFMRCLNEPIARMANQEDDCTGRFWEGRFKSQALLDERALLACMAYVDLNPIRAAISTTPEQSDFTSIQERIRHPSTTMLRPFAGNPDHATGLPFELNDYIKLLDWAGQEVSEGKEKNTQPARPPILNRLGMEANPVISYLKRNERLTPVALGPVSRLRCFAQSVGQHFIKGLVLGRALCPEPE
jgi:REP element-mobilizing transposase RayT